MRIKKCFFSSRRGFTTSYFFVILLLLGDTTTELQEVFYVVYIFPIAKKALSTDRLVTKGVIWNSLQKGGNPSLGRNHRPEDHIPLPHRNDPQVDVDTE